MLMPFMRAASKTVVPLDTRTDLPSMLISIIPGRGAEVVMAEYRLVELHLGVTRR